MKFRFLPLLVLLTFVQAREDNPERIGKDDDDDQHVSIQQVPRILPVVFPNRTSSVNKTDDNSPSNSSCSYVSLSMDFTLLLSCLLFI
jgi:hypothetical protein